MDLDHPFLAAQRADMPAVPARSEGITARGAGGFAPAMAQMRKAEFRHATPLTDQAVTGNQLSGDYTEITHGDHGPAQLWPTTLPSSHIDSDQATPGEPDWPLYNPAGQGGEHAAPLGVIG